MEKWILVVGEDPQAQRLLAYQLARGGFGVEGVLSAEEALARLEEAVPDAMVVSEQAADCGGLRLCRRASAFRCGGSDMPLVVIGSGAGTESRCACYECGAWDVLEKPVDGAELCLRLRAHLQGAHATGGDSETVQAGQMRLDTRNHVASLGEVSVSLTPNECAILKKLLEEPGKAFDVETLLVEALGYPPRLGNPEIVRTHVRNLRQKLERDPRVPRVIVNLPRIGYSVCVGDRAV